MKKRNLLEIVQSSLRAMGSDNVSSISDTEESEDVALFAEEAYYELVSRDDWKHVTRASQLTGLGDTSHPTHMKIPTDVNNIDYIKYDVREKVGDSARFKEILQFVDPRDFLDFVHSRNSTESNVVTVNDFGGATIYVLNDAAPSRWTSFDDTYIVFDAVDKGIDNTLVQSKSAIIGTKTPVFSQTDAFIPELPGKMFPTYQARVTLLSFQNIKQSNAPLYAQEEQRGFSTMRRAAIRTKLSERQTNYGRRTR